MVIKDLVASLNMSENNTFPFFYFDYSWNFCMIQYENRYCNVNFIFIFSELKLITTNSITLTNFGIMASILDFIKKDI